MEPSRQVDASRRSPPTSLSLLGRMRSGDARAWEEFDRFHRGLILHWARALGCGDDLAEDVCQETMVSLLRALPGFEHDGRGGGFHAFLKTLARSRAIDAMRRRNRARGDSKGDATPLVPEPVKPEAEAAEDTVWVRTLVRRACERAFERLDSTTYRAFCLYAIQGMDVAETARRVGVDRVATVYQQKSRVLQAVREAMREILRELDDPELRETAGRLRGPEAVALLAEFVSGNPDVRLTCPAEPPALDRIALVRRALELCAGRGGAVLALPADGRVVPLGGADVTIGSRGADVPVDRPGVSGRHCMLVRKGASWAVVDEGSRNGTLVNGRRVQRAELADGDVLTLGEGHLVFLDPDRAAGPVSPGQAGEPGEKKRAGP